MRRADRAGRAAARGDAVRVRAGRGRSHAAGGHRRAGAAEAALLGGDVVLSVDELEHPEQVEYILRHELTHAATLARGPENTPAEAWWLVEGIADHAEAHGHSAEQYGAGALIRRCMREAKWKGDLSTLSAGALEKDWSITAKYGLGFLAVRRLAERYGRAKLLRFFEQVVHQDVAAADAAQSVFGSSLKSVYADCLRYTRDVVGA